MFRLFMSSETTLCCCFISTEITIILLHQMNGFLMLCDSTFLCELFAAHVTYVFEIVLSYNVANVDNLTEIQEPTYRDWSNDLSGSNCSVQWSDRQLLRDSSLLSGVLLTKKSLAMTSEHVEMQLILER